MGQALNNLISWGQPCFEQGTGAQQFPLAPDLHPPHPTSLLDWMPSLYGQRGASQLQELCPHYCYVQANVLFKQELMNTPYSRESSLFRSPRKTYLLTSEGRDWQSCAAGCFGCASQMNAVTRPGYEEGKQQHLCLLWYTAGEGTQGGLYFYQRTSSWRTQFKPETFKLCQSLNGS